MHTITECPRCGKDFMYHQTDTYLNRDVLVGSNGYEHLEPIVICQDCHLKEKWVGKEVKITNPYYPHLNDFTLVVDSIVIDERYPITVKIGNMDSYEWLDEDELKIIDSEIANIASFIEEKAEHRGWENAEYMAADKFGEEKTLKAIQHMDKYGFNNNHCQ